MRFLAAILITFGLLFFSSFALADDPDDGSNSPPDGVEEKEEGGTGGEEKEEEEEEELSPEEEFLRKMREEMEKQMEKERKGIERAEVPGAKEDGDSELQKVLKEIVKNMHEAERYLAKHNPDKPCKIEIDAANKKLDMLIELAQQQMQGEGGGQQQQKSNKPKGKGKQPGQSQKKRKDPGQKQGAKPGDGKRERNDQRSSAYQRKRSRARATLERLKKIAREAEEMRGGEWGNLPPKIREDALDAQADEFPERYRDLIEEYYRRLSGEKNR